MRTKLLRDIKTESLLIYIRSILEELINQIENNRYKIDLKDDQVSAEIQKNIFFLYNNLQKSVLSPKELGIKIVTSNNEITKYNAIAFYYNNMLKEIQSSLKEGDHWIPEQVIFSLLSEWVLEEEKPTIGFPFLEKIDYIKLLSFYEKPKANEEYKKNLLKMYRISGSMIKKLKSSKFRSNNKRRKKR